MRVPIQQSNRNQSTRNHTQNLSFAAWPSQHTHKRMSRGHVFQRSRPRTRDFQRRTLRAVCRKFHETSLPSQFRSNPARACKALRPGRLHAPPAPPSPSLPMSQSRVGVYHQRTHVLVFPASRLRIANTWVIGNVITLVRYVYVNTLRPSVGEELLQGLITTVIALKFGIFSDAGGGGGERCKGRRWGLLEGRWGGSGEEHGRFGEEAYGGEG